MWSFDGNGVCKWVAWGEGGGVGTVVGGCHQPLGCVYPICKVSRLVSCYVLLMVTTHGAELDSSWFSLSTPLDGSADLVEPDVIGPSRA